MKSPSRLLALTAGAGLALTTLLSAGPIPDAVAARYLVDRSFRRVLIGLVGQPLWHGVLPLSIQ